MYFYDPEDRRGKELVAGVTTRTFWGEKMLVSLVDLEPQAVIAAHSHPHEQIGVVVVGEYTMIIGDETRLVQTGDIYIIPGGVSHSVVTGHERATAFEVFSPVREEYKY
jgi:quercetin dioxygenase-like cupin family protein